MLVLSERNVNDLYRRAVSIVTSDYPSMSWISGRGGRALVYDTPVTSVYARPRERVLFDAGRDANPFFHLMESLWMLSGDYDAWFLNLFVKDFGERFAEPGYTQGAGYIHGAYGRRWRRWFDLDNGAEEPRDQLEGVISDLRRDPTSRQAVIAMWDPVADLNRPSLKDRPCNTHVYLRLHDTEAPLVPRLDLTVLCRSNDLYWGAYGANAVQFSVLHEYLAWRLGVTVGTMYQVSNNWHIYEHQLDRIRERSERIEEFAEYDGLDPHDAVGLIQPQAMGSDWSKWDADLAAFMQWARGVGSLALSAGPVGMLDPNVVSAHFINGWFRETAVPMFRAALNARLKRWGPALKCAEMVTSPDWRVAAMRWIQRRYFRGAGR